MHQSPYLLALPFGHAKFVSCQLTKKITIQQSRHILYIHARLTKLCLLDGSNGYLALLVEFDTKLHKSPYLETLPFGHAKSVSLQHKTKLLYTNYYDYIACLTELCLLDREKGFGSLAEPIGFWMLVGW